VPHVALEDRVSVKAPGRGFFDVRLRYGFMEDPDVPQALINACAHGLMLDEHHVT
jgi:KUP system potassium uptake protein